MTARQEEGIGPLRLDNSGPETMRDGESGTAGDGLVTPYPVGKNLALTDALQLLGPALLDKLRVDGLRQDGGNLGDEGLEAFLGTRAKGGPRGAGLGPAPESDSSAPGAGEGGGELRGVRSAQLGDVDPAAPGHDLAAEFAMVMRGCQKGDPCDPVDEDPAGRTDSNKLPFGSYQRREVEGADRLELRVDAPLYQSKLIPG